MMIRRLRWLALGMSLLVLLVGALSLFRNDASVGPWVAMLGLAIGLIVVMVALLDDSARRSPAVVGLLGAAPMLQLVLPGHPQLSDAAELLSLLGGIGTVLAALAIVLRKPAQPAVDPIARAVAQSRSSE